MVKLDVLKYYLVLFIRRLGLFLTFGDFEPRCFYKIVLIQRKECILVERLRTMRHMKKPLVLK